MKKLVAMLLSLIMILSLSGITLVSAANGYTTFTPKASPGPTTEETTINTGIAGMTLMIGADQWGYTAESYTSSNGNKYTGYIVGKANPKPNEQTGTYYKFVFDNTIETGMLEIAYRHGTKSLYITDNGVPMEGYNGLTREKDMNVDSTIMVKGGHTYVLYVSGSKARLYGCSFKNVDPKKEFADEISNIPFDLIKGTNTDQNNVENDLELVQSYESQFGSCDVRWETTNSDVIANDGTVNAQKTETKVTITGIFTVQEDNSLGAQKSFEITVLADPDDNSAVEAAKAALTLGDVSALKSNITLPSVGRKGTSITWQTSDSNVISADGVIKASPGIDKTAVLTATISRGEASATKEFTVTVKGFVDLTVESYSYADKDGNPCYTPVDGGKLKGINVTRSNPNPDSNDEIITAIYTKDGLLKDCKMFAISEIKFDSSMPLDVSLPMDSTDIFKIFAMNIENMTPYINPIEPDDALKSGAKIYVVGDSTASAYDDKNYPRKGWAQELHNYFDGVSVVDLAISGKSSVDFKEQANYNTLKSSIKSGDYLIIQFGHNDSKFGEARYSDPHNDRFTDGSYKKSMYEYVELAWSKGAHPIIATSISRRQLSDNTNTDTKKGLELYVNAAKELAAELNIPCIDLYAKTNGWINEVGLDKACDMFNYVKAYDSRFVDYSGFSKSGFYKTGTTDNTHININGANLIAQWAADAMRDMGIPIGQKRNAKTATYPLPSYADATSVN